jgi:DNA-binding winged helix-turn-helix (wHTH) protein
MPETSGEAQTITCFDEFQLNRQLRSLQRGGQQLRLPAKPFATLEFLIENRRRVVPKSELLRQVWGGRQEINTVEQAVRRIRKVLGDDSDKPRYIETIPGEGYRFIAEVHALEPAETAPDGDSPRPSRRNLLIAAGVGAPLVCLTGLGAFRLLHRTEPVARVAINGTSLVAMSARGDVLWTYPFNEPLAEAFPEESGWRTPDRRPGWGRSPGSFAGGRFCVCSGSPWRNLLLLLGREGALALQTYG